MNARSQLLELSVQHDQVQESVLSLFHTLLFHRSTGKFHYKKDDTYSIGTIGITDVACKEIDFNYVRCNSETLDTSLRKDVSNFCLEILSPTTPSTGQITLEFYQRKRGRWPFSSESTPWEVWNLRINLVTVNNDNERQEFRKKVGEMLFDHLRQMTQSINKGDYTPAPPNQAEIDLVYDTSFTDVQPYLFKVYHSHNVYPTVSTAVKRLLRDPLSFT